MKEYRTDLPYQAFEVIGETQATHLLLQSPLLERDVTPRILFELSRRELKPLIGEEIVVSSYSSLPLKQNRENELHLITESGGEIALKEPILINLPDPEALFTGTKISGLNLDDQDGRIIMSFKGKKEPFVVAARGIKVLLPGSTKRHGAKTRS